MPVAQFDSAPARETYTARLHLVQYDSEHKTTSHRTLWVGGLALPHIELLADVTIVDAKANQTYPSVYAVPHLFAVEFPEISNPARAHDPDWQSREKREVYDKALEKNQGRLADKILGTPREAELHSTHFVAGYDETGKPILMSASKFGEVVWPTIQMGRLLTAYTFGPAREDRSDAFRHVIGEAARNHQLPAPSNEITGHVNLKQIALWQGMVAHEELPLNAHYLLENYTPDGQFILSADNRAMAPITEHEAASLRAQGITADPETSLSRKAMLALVRLRLDEAYPDKAQLLAPYPVIKPLTADELREERRLVNEKLCALPKASRGEIPTDPAEIARRREALEADWARREKLRTAERNALQSP